MVSEICSACDRVVLRILQALTPNESFYNVYVIETHRSANDTDPSRFYSIFLSLADSDLTFSAPKIPNATDLSSPRGLAMDFTRPG